jgi:hypothetical protein
MFGSTEQNIVDQIIQTFTKDFEDISIESILKHSLYYLDKNKVEINRSGDLCLYVTTYIDKEKILVKRIFVYPEGYWRLSDTTHMLTLRDTGAVRIRGIAPPIE